VIDICGIPIRIVDTAGILEPKDLIEKKAIARSRKEIKASDLAILLFDGSRILSKEDFMLIRRLKKKKVIAVINKIDLKQKIDKDKIASFFDILIEISAKKLLNIKLLERSLVDVLYAGKVLNSESVIVSNLRHIHLIRKIQKSIAQVQESLDNKLSLEFIAQEIRGALGGLDHIMGKSFSADLLNKIFSEFCIGK